jgi:hypothetical protein
MDLRLRINIELDKPTNYLILGWWNASISYKLSDAGIPVVKVEDGSTAGFSAYSLVANASTAGLTPPNSQWKLVETAEFIYMMNAYIERLQFEVASGGGFEVGDGLFKSIAKNADDEPMIKLDGTNGSGNLAGGNISWNSDGDLFLKGGLASPFFSFSNSFSTKYSNNYFIESSGGWTTYFTIPFDSEQNGRSLRILSTGNGGARADAPTGKYFYEDGIQKTILFIESNQIVELLGWGTSTNFNGWIVLHRDYVDTSFKYGEIQRIIAEGKVVGSSSGASIKFHTYNGSTMSVSRSAVGTYNVFFDNLLFDAKDDYYVMLTGVTTDTSNYRMKATVLNQFTSYFKVEVSDDASANDGSFYFQVFSAKNFVY